MNSYKSINIINTCIQALKYQIEDFEGTVCTRRQRQAIRELIKLRKRMERM